jgi:hypothetical protein
MPDKSSAAPMAETILDSTSALRPGQLEKKNGPGNAGPRGEAEYGIKMLAMSPISSLISGASS